MIYSDRGNLLLHVIYTLNTEETGVISIFNGYLNLPMRAKNTRRVDEKVKVLKATVSACELSITSDRSFQMVCCGIQCRRCPGYENQVTRALPPWTAFRWILMPYFKLCLDYLSPILLCVIFRFYYLFDISVITVENNSVL